MSRITSRFGIPDTVFCFACVNAVLSVVDGVIFSVACSGSTVVVVGNLLLRYRVTDDVRIVVVVSEVDVVSVTLNSKYARNCPTSLYRQPYRSRLHPSSSLCYRDLLEYLESQNKMF